MLARQHRRNDSHVSHVSHAGPCYGPGKYHFPASERHRWRQEEACVNHHSNVDTRLNHYGNMKHLPVVTASGACVCSTHTLPPLLSFSFLTSVISCLTQPMDHTDRNGLSVCYTHTSRLVRLCLFLLLKLIPSHSTRLTKLSTARPHLSTRPELLFEAAWSTDVSPERKLCHFVLDKFSEK